MAFYINKRSDPRIDFSNKALSVGYKIKQVRLRALVEYRRSRFRQSKRNQQCQSHATSPNQNQNNTCEVNSD